MTDHAGVLTPLLLEPRDKSLEPHEKSLVEIGRVLSAQESPFIGSRQSGLGFGEDASAEFADAFARAMIGVEFRPNLNPKDDPPQHNAISATWMASIRGRVAKAPSWIIREDRGIVNVPGSKEEYKYREKSISVYEFTHAKYVKPFDALLIPQFIPSEYSLEWLMRGAPRVTKPESVQDCPGWRYQVMTGLLWHDLGPNLRTTEMMNHNGVWRRLNKYFWDLHNLYGHWEMMHEETRNRERGSWLLALYEQTMLMLHERWHDLPHYRQTISQRQPIGNLAEDPILALPHRATEEDDLAEARMIRSAEYNSLLLATLANCHSALLCLE